MFPANQSTTRLKNNYPDFKLLIPYNQLLCEEQLNMHIKYLNVSTTCKSTVFIPEKVS